MKIEIHSITCKSCGQALNYCKLIEMDESGLNHEDDSELLDVGRFIKVTKVGYTIPFREGIVLNTKSINLDDHEESSRLYGCCGPSSFGKLNQVCPNCNAEIGLLIADCWMPHFVGIKLSKVDVEFN